VLEARAVSKNQIHDLLADNKKYTPSYLWALYVPKGTLKGQVAEGGKQKNLPMSTEKYPQLMLDSTIIWEHVKM
jgi:hypothetical protein